MLNVDTINVAQSLWSTPALRTSIEAAASDYVKTNVGTGADCSNQASQAEQNLINLRSWALPLFWSTQPQDPRAYPWLHSSLEGWVSKVVGILLSVLAVSLGAPFWFDLLSRFVNVRSSGPPPSRADSSPS